MDIKIQEKVLVNKSQEKIDKISKKLDELTEKIKRAEALLEKVKNSNTPKKEKATKIKELEDRIISLKEQKRAEMHKFFKEKREKDNLENAYNGIFDPVEELKKEAEVKLKEVQELDEKIKIGGMVGIQAAFAKRRLLVDIIYKFRQAFEDAYLQICALRRSGARDSLTSREKVALLDRKLSVIEKETMKYQQMKEIADTEVNSLKGKNDLGNRKRGFYC